MCPHDSVVWAWLFTALLSVGPVAPYTTSELCTACRDMSTAFRKGLEASRRSNYGGGNTAWEESRLGAWALSETRLVGVMEKICEEATKPPICSSLVEEHEETVEEWWKNKFKDDPKNADLFRFLCIQRLKVCCAANHFGKKCTPCPGIVHKTTDSQNSEQVPCNGHGSCEGGGDRSGSGLCSCEAGYKGHTCDSCSDDYFNASRNSSTLCETCHEACKNGCSGSGPELCSVACQSGWTFEKGRGCSDVNECSNNTACGQAEFCVNEPGSYRCDVCDVSCASCSGPGTANCSACAQGYRRGPQASPGALGSCEDVNECLEGGCPQGKVCTNLPGSHECTCPQGQKEDDEGKCIPHEEETKSKEESDTTPSPSHGEL